MAESDNIPHPEKYRDHHPTFNRKTAEYAVMTVIESCP
jgi:hypothetical protein